MKTLSPVTALLLLALLTTIQASAATSTVKGKKGTVRTGFLTLSGATNLTLTGTSTLAVRPVTINSTTLTLNSAVVLAKTALQPLVQKTAPTTIGAQSGSLVGVLGPLLVNTATTLALNGGLVPNWTNASAVPTSQTPTAPVAIEAPEQIVSLSAGGHVLQVSSGLTVSSLQLAANVPSLAVSNPSLTIVGGTLQLTNQFHVSSIKIQGQCAMTLGVAPDSPFQFNASIDSANPGTAFASGNVAEASTSAGALFPTGTTVRLSSLTVQSAVCTVTNNSGSDLKIRPSSTIAGGTEISAGVVSP